MVRLLIKALQRFVLANCYAPREVRVSASLGAWKWGKSITLGLGRASRKKLANVGLSVLVFFQKRGYDC